MTSNRAARIRAWIANLLLLAGVAGVGVWVWSTVRLRVFQHRESHAFDDHIGRTAPPATAPPESPPEPGSGAPIGRLTIPRLHLRAMVREGAGEATLAVALGHIPGTALPGQPGNIGIAGHRDTLFRALRTIAKGDTIVLQTTQRSYSYSVEELSIVKPQDVAVLASRSYPEITLVTCYPFYYVGPAPERFIVRARLDNPPPPPGTLSLQAASPGLLESLPK
jgi:sortase A